MTIIVNDAQLLISKLNQMWEKENVTFDKTAYAYLIL